ncbi:MAG TPA: hypothetical protein VGO46_01640 [Gemmatimonadaceae bacterium]|nr:hypothetical protein [Gemmatimonadaceae bacterium]
MPRLAVSAALALLLASAACRHPHASPPAGEFLVLAGDSTFWVHTGAEGIRARGSPLHLARYRGRFYEVYITDDDRSYTDALIVGQQMYRRDLLSDDSALVFEDTTITHIARWYGRSHPNDHPLDTDDEPDAEPHVSAQSELNTIAQHGQYLSYEYKADLSVTGSEEWHIARRGVVDLRDAAAPTVADIFGASNGQYILRRGRTLFAQARDSLRATSDAMSRDAARAIGDFRFDDASFNIDEVNGEPAVKFYAPGHGARAGGYALPLPAIPVSAPGWWEDARDGLPAAGDGSGIRWSHKGYRVVARPSHDDSALLSIVDSSGHEWRIAELPALPRRIFWVDSASTDGATRRALARAFDEAALYSDEVRAASMHLSPRIRPSRIHLVSESRARERVVPRRGRELPIRTRTLP